MEFDVFPTALDMGERNWGTETLLVLVPGKYTVKRIEIKAGEKGGLQYHHLKDEVGVIISGTMIVRYDHGNGLLSEKIVGPGGVIHFSPGLVHQSEAISDVVYIEASTPHFNDRMRVEESYGMEAEAGLPSTAIEEVISR